MTNQKKTDYICISKESEGPAPDTLDETLPSSAFPAILLYAQELLPNKLGLISGLFFGFAFGIAGIASAVLGGMADKYGIEAVYNVCAFMPLLGLVACFLPNLKKR